MKYVDKGWGNELWIVNSPLYCGKILTLDGGKACALHWHDKKDETFFVEDGLVYVHYAAHDALVEDCPLILQTVKLCAGQHFYVEPGLIHMLQAVNGYRVRIFEFSTHHEDADSFFIHPGDEFDLGVANVQKWIRRTPIVYQNVERDYFRFDVVR